MCLCFVILSIINRSSCPSSSVLGYIVDSMAVCVSAASFIIIFKCSHITTDCLFSKMPLVITSNWVCPGDWVNS